MARFREEEEAVGSWPVCWSAVWVGALSAMCLALVIGLIGIALGAHRVGRGVASWTDVSLLALVVSVFGAFISFAAGGWIAARIAGVRRSEPAMLHGAVMWVVAVPIMLVLVSLGAAADFGAWYGGLAGPPAWVAAQATASWDPGAAIAARNGALAAVTALLLGLVGGVIGGWMGSGEPMTLTHYRKRAQTVRATTGG